MLQNDSTGDISVMCVFLEELRGTQQTVCKI